MDVAFVDESGMKNNGIYPRQVIDHKHCDSTIVRKSFTCYGINDLEAIKKAQKLPNGLLKKYRQIHRNKS
jgi:hypothetical protein